MRDAMESKSKYGSFRSGLCCFLACYLLIVGKAAWAEDALNCQPENTYRGMTVAECNALMQLYYATDGPNWHHTTLGTVPWGENGPRCNTYPYAVICSDGEPGERHVIKLELSNYNLTGELPGAAFAALPYLVKISLHFNSLNGFIPVEIANLAYLKELNLSYNALTGQIPEGLLGDQESPYPAQINYRQLNLQYNDLTGTLPESLGADTLYTFYVYENERLTGPVPHTYTVLNELVSFQYNTTQVCEPQDQEMQDWLSQYHTLYSA